MTHLPNSQTAKSEHENSPLIIAKPAD